MACRAVGCTGERARNRATLAWAATPLKARTPFSVRRGPGAARLRPRPARSLPHGQGRLVPSRPYRSRRRTTSSSSGVETSSTSESSIASIVWISPGAVPPGVSLPDLGDREAILARALGQERAGHARGSSPRPSRGGTGATAAARAGRAGSCRRSGPSTHTRSRSPRACRSAPAGGRAKRPCRLLRPAGVSPRAPRPGASR